MESQRLGFKIYCFLFINFELKELFLFPKLQFLSCAVAQSLCHI